MKQNIFNQGFTLIELGLVTSLTVITMATANLFWQNIQREYQFTSSQYQLTDEVNQTLRKLATEARQAEVAMDGAYPLAILEDNQFAFYADIDNDGLVERRRYFLENSSLKRGIVNPSGNPPTYNMSQEIVSELINSIDTSKLPLFYYYNGDWPEDTTNNPLSYWERPLETRLIRMIIPLSVNDQGQNYTYESSTTVHIRNLKNNL